MRDDDGGAPRAQALQRLLHECLAFSVERTRGLVEQQDARVAQQRTGESDALALAARQPLAARADAGLVAVRQGGNERRRRGRTGCRFDLRVGRGRSAHPDIGADRVVEQQDVLSDIGNRVTQACERQVAHIRPVDADRCPR